MSTSDLKTLRLNEILRLNNICIGDNRAEALVVHYSEQLSHLSPNRIKKIVDRILFIDKGYWPSLEKMLTVNDKVHDEEKQIRTSDNKSMKDVMLNAKQPPKISDADWKIIQQRNKIVMDMSITKQERAEKLISTGDKESMKIGNDILCDIKYCKEREEQRKKKMEELLREKTLLTIKQKKEKKDHFNKIS